MFRINAVEKLKFSRKFLAAGFGLIVVAALVSFAFFAKNNRNVSAITVAPTITVNSFAELQAAVSTANAGTPQVINVATSFDMTAKINITGNVVIESQNGASLTRPVSFLTGEFFSVAVGGKLALDDGLTLDGKTVQMPEAGGYAAMAVSSAGDLTVDGATITNFAGFAPAIEIADGTTMTMDSGVISSNINNYQSTNAYLYLTDPANHFHGGGVNLGAGATMTMNGGTITKNYAVFFGGGIMMNKNASFTLNNGNIDSNTGFSGSVFGGGIMSFENATVKLLGGSVSGNSAYNGGGIWFDSGTFILNGARINGNSSTRSGGGISFTDYYNSRNMNVELIAGSVSNNKALNGNGGGIYDYAQTFNMTLRDVSISRNTALAGGGIANCPTGNFNNYLSNGGIYSDNTATSVGSNATLANYTGGDFYFKVAPSASNTGATTILPGTLGGGT
jgi:hypothetical protein